MENKISKKISIVVPVFNSMDCVEPLVKRVDECLIGSDYELILVNDCSSDGSWDAIKKACSCGENVVGINLRKNSGQDNALMAGLRQVQGAYVIIMDDDLQHDPADIPRLVSKLEEGYDVCYANFEQKKQAWWKNFGSWFNGKVAEVIVDKPKGIYLSPFKAVVRDVINEVIRYEGPYPYVDGLILTITRLVCQIPAIHHGRHAGESNYSLLRSIAVWMKLSTGYSVLPLRIATVTGFVTSTFGFILILAFIFEHYFLHENPTGWMSLMTVTLVLGGTILVSLGTIGEYVGRSYLLLNNKPQFTYKEILRKN